VRVLRSLVLTATLAPSLLAAMPAHAEEPPPAPVRYPPSSVRPKLVAGGLIVAGIGYGAAILGSEAALNWPGAHELKAPVIGPWWALALNGCPVNRTLDPERPSGQVIQVYVEPCDAWQYFRAGLLVLDGLIQAAGLGIAVQALVMKTEGAGAKPAKSAMSFSLGNVTVHPAPMVTPTSGGIGFVGTF
jgi:hypothetical protein